MPDTRALVSFLRSAAPTSNLLDWLKLVYRPAICPFDDLLEWVDGDSIFDIGCGSGAFCLLAAHFFNVKRVGAVDTSSASVDRARLLVTEYSRSVSGLEIDIRCCSAEQLPDSFSTYDTFFLIDVLHHTQQSRQLDLLSRIYDLMPTDGRLVLKDIEVNSALVVFNKLHDFMLNGGAGHELSGAFVEQTLRDIGFRVHRTIYRRMLVYPHYTIVATK